MSDSVNLRKHQDKHDKNKFIEAEPKRIFSYSFGRKKMGNRSTGTGSQTLSDHDIRLLSQKSQLPPHILQQLYEAFLERAGKNGR